MSTNYFAKSFAGCSSYDSIGESVRVFAATVPGREQSYLNQSLYFRACLNHRNKKIKNIFKKSRCFSVGSAQNLEGLHLQASVLHSVQYLSQVWIKINTNCKKHLCYFQILFDFNSTLCPKREVGGRVLSHVWSRQPTGGKCIIDIIDKFL